MGDSKIDWTEKAWNVFTGCNKVSTGCRACYAERIWKKVYGRTGRAFTDVMFHEDRLDHPRRWKKPAKVFVNSMSDLFHESIPFHQIAQVWDVMFDCGGAGEICERQHVFQILTKRPERAFSFMAWMRRSAFRGVNYPNVHVGVSVEDQSRVGRLDLLRDFDTAVPWVSLEPLIGPVDIKPYLDFLKWVVIGGESGPLKDPGIRPMHPKWAMDIIEDCKAAGVPVFFKQWGAWGPFPLWRLSDGRPEQTILTLDGQRVNLDAISDGQHPGATVMRKVGKDAAGHKIGGQTFREYPKGT